MGDNAGWFDLDLTKLTWSWRGLVLRHDGMQCRVPDRHCGNIAELELAIFTCCRTDARYLVLLSVNEGAVGFLLERTCSTATERASDRFRGH
jgi:hypothetical protein